MLATLLLRFAAIPRRVKIGVAIALVVTLALALAYCDGKRDAQRASDLALERANTKVITTDNRAREAAATDRVVDAIKNAEAKKELSDAVADLPDTLPSARRIQLGCQRLRRQGTDVSSIPACR